MKKFLLSLILTLSVLCGSVNAEFVSDLIVTSPTGIWTDSRAYSSLQDAITAIGANNQTLTVAGPQTVAALTIPANINLRFERTGSITYTGNLVINTPNISAPNHQVFYPQGAGEADFARGTNLRSSWFANLNQMFDQTVDNYVTLIICSGWNAGVTADAIVGDNVTLKWEGPGNLIVINAGFTLSNIRRIEAGDYQIFAGSGDLDFFDGISLNLYWFNRLRTVLGWIENELVTIVVPGSNVVDYSEVSPANVIYDFRSRYGSFNISAGVTLEVHSHLNIIASDTQQITSGAGNLDFTVASTAPLPWWGAVGDGVTDNNDNAVTGILSRALSATVEKGGTLIIPKMDDYYLFSVGATISADADGGTIICDGALRFTGTTGSALTLGDGATRLSYFTIGGRGLWIEGNADWSDGHTGLDIKGCFDGKFNIFYITGFTYGVNLSGVTYGTEYCAFNLNKVIDNKIDIYLSTDANNENNFYGGRLSSNLTAHTGHLDGSSGIHISASNNNNRFYGPSIEEGTLSKKDYKIYCNGTHNYFISPRLETSATKANAYFDTSSQYNTMESGYPSYSPRTNNSIVDVGNRNNFISERIQVWDGVQWYRPTSGSIVAPVTGNWKQGDVYWQNPNALVLSYREIGWLCITTGTFGVLNSGTTTGSINVGSASLTVNDAADLARNQYVTVAGVTGTKKVIDIVGTTITLDSVSDATVAAAAVAYASPDFKPFGHNVEILPNAFNTGAGEEGMVAWNPAAMNDGDVATQTVNVTGAEFGDFVMVSCGESLVGCTLTGYVSAADTITFVLKNTSGGVVNIGNTWFRAKVYKWAN